MIVCPGAATLTRFGADSLEGPAFATIEEHIESCAACQTRLERLRNNDARGDDAASSLPGPDALPRIAGFEIECELGRGGMGVVYRAFNRALAARSRSKL